MNKIIDELRDKKIAILGFGMEGKSTYRYIRKYLPNQVLYVIDIKDVSTELDSNTIYIKFDNNIDFNEYDLIFKSPGISLHDFDISSFKDKITSEYDILVNNYREQIIGVTGTKGKSTTSSLIYEVLKNNGKDVYLLGNIGIPIFDYLDDIESDTILVVELSAYQLEYPNVSPKYSIILNLYEEHLDYFHSLDNYYNSKLNITRYQSNSDYFFYSIDNKELVSRVKTLDRNTNMISISHGRTDSDIYIKNEFVYFKNKKVYDINSKRNLLGLHNLVDIMFALGIASIFNLDIKKSVEAVNNFKSLSHRLEYVGEYNGIKYYDDAIATIPEATINAINTLESVDTLIIGGKDRGINYNILIDYLNKSNITNIICMPETGFKISQSLNNYIKVDTLEEAVEYAKKHTKNGMICLLSPAAPSHNKYKNFEEKGNRFKELVKGE